MKRASLRPIILPFRFRKGLSSAHNMHSPLGFLNGETPPLNQLELSQCFIAKATYCIKDNRNLALTDEQDMDISMDGSILIPRPIEGTNREIPAEWTFSSSSNNKDVPMSRMAYGKQPDGGFMERY